MKIEVLNVKLRKDRVVVVRARRDQVHLVGRGAVHDRGHVVRLGLVRAAGRRRRGAASASASRVRARFSFCGGFRDKRSPDARWLLDPAVPPSFLSSSTLQPHFALCPFAHPHRSCSHVTSHHQSTGHILLLARP